MGRFQLELIYLYFPPSSHLDYVCFCPVEVTSTPTRPVDNAVITTKGLQDKNIHSLDGTTVENKGKLITVTDQVSYNKQPQRRQNEYKCLMTSH